MPGAVLRQIRADVDAQPVDLRRLVLSRALGAPVDPAVLAPVLDMPADAAAALVDQGVAAGLLLDDGSLPPLVRLAVLGGGGVAHRAALHRRIAAVRLELGGDVSDLARSLIGTGLHGREIAAVLERAADDALLRGRPGADELYDAAVEAGTPGPELADRRAEAALLSGDLDAAMAAADQVLGDWSGPEPNGSPARSRSRRPCSRTAGLLARSAELHRLAGRSPGAGPAVAAVPALIGTGALAEAEEILGAPAPVTAAAHRAGGGRGAAGPGCPPGRRRFADGRAVGSRPRRGAGGSVRAAVLLADTPAALAAVVAVQCGELDVAQSVLERATACGSAGGRWPPAPAAARAGSRCCAATPRGTHARRASPTRAGRRAAGAARRVGRRRARGRARPPHAATSPRSCRAWAGPGRRSSAIPSTCSCCSSSASCSSRPPGCGRRAGSRPHLDEAAALLDRLGNPALWAAPLHWAGLQAAIVAESREEAAQRHATASRPGGGSRYAAALAAAAPHWVPVLDAEVDADAVEKAARGLHAVGLAWEGGRLAGQAAIRTRDRKAMSALLGCAPRPAEAPATVGRPGRTPTGRRPPRGLPRPGPAPSTARARADERRPAAHRPRARGGGAGAGGAHLQADR